MRFPSAALVACIALLGSTGVLAQARVVIPPTPRDPPRETYPPPTGEVERHCEQPVSEPQPNIKEIYCAGQETFVAGPEQGDVPPGQPLLNIRNLKVTITKGGEVNHPATIRIHFEQQRRSYSTVESSWTPAVFLIDQDGIIFAQIPLNGTASFGLICERAGWNGQDEFKTINIDTPDWDRVKKMAYAMGTHGVAFRHC